MLQLQKEILTIWRISLALTAFVPAFITSLLFQPGTPFWIMLTALWILLFLFFYLFYLPVRYRKLAFAVRGDSLVVRSGVFSTRVRTMPLQNIQYSGLVVSPLDAVWGLGSLVVTAPGGRIRIPGLRRQDAENLAAMLPEEWHREH